MCTTDRHDGSCTDCETDEWINLTPIQRASLAAFNRGTREAAAEFAARITPTFKENPMPTDHHRTEAERLMRIAGELGIDDPASATSKPPANTSPSSKFGTSSASHPDTQL